MSEIIDFLIMIKKNILLKLTWMWKDQRVSLVQQTSFMLLIVSMFSRYSLSSTDGRQT